MSKKNVKIADRILAVFLTVIMLFSMMPVSIFAGAADTDYIITVTDEKTGKPVSGAKIVYDVEVDGAPSEDGLEAISDENGVVVVDLEGYDEAKANGSVISIAYTVTKDGYDEKKSEIEVSELDGSSEIKLKETEAAPETVAVAVTKEGNGSVTINGESDVTSAEKGSDLTIRVTPDDGWCIRSLTVGDEEITVEKKDEAFTYNCKADKDIAVKVTFAEITYKVTVEADKGSVKLNGEALKEITVKKGGNVTLAITPDKHYQISGIKLNGEEQLDGNKTEYKKTITVNEDTTIVVSFVEVHTVTVKYDSAKGTAEIEKGKNGENGTIVFEKVEGSSSIFEATEKFIVKAIPDKGFRVSKVVKNDEEITFTENGKQYISDEITADKDYTFDVTFASNIYDITVNEIEYGVIEAPKTVLHGEAVTVKITPDMGYGIKKITLNDEQDVDLSTLGSENDGETFILTITEVSTHLKINVVLEGIPSVNFEDEYVKFNEDDRLNYFPETNTYVFDKGAKVTFSTEKKGIRIYSDSESKDRIDHNTWKSQSCTFNEDGKNASVTIGAIWVYVSDGKISTKPWTPITLEKPINIVFDETTPNKPVITPEVSANGNGYYNDNIPVKISATDPGDFSGIKSVEYEIKANVNGEDVVENTTLYAYSETNEVLGTLDGNIEINAQTFNSEKVTLTVTVTDRAGNSSVDSKIFKINSTPPEVNIEFKGTSKENSENGYYETASVVVTFTDRKDTFDGAKATESIKVTAVDLKGETVENSYRRELNSTNQTVTVYFDKDANYTVSVENYTNKADMSCSSENAESFCVDTKAPTGEIAAAGSSWDEIVENLTFGIFRSSKVEAIATATDAVAGINEIVYYKDNGTELISELDLDTLYSDGKFTEEAYSIGGDDAENERFVVYARIMDKAGNYMYIGTNGIVYDNTKSTIAEFKMPAYPKNQPDGSCIYNSNIEIGVDVSEIAWQAVGEDGAIEEIYSGLKEVKYALYKDRIVDPVTEDVIAEGECTSEGILFEAITGNEDEPSYTVNEFKWVENGADGEIKADGNLVNLVSKNTLPEYADLVKEWNGVVRVNAEEYNSDNVTLIVTATDNVGKITVKEEHFSINVDKPEVDIKVGAVDLFDETTGELLAETFNKETLTDEAGIGTEHGYYAASRQALITITERATAFNAANASDCINITAYDSKGNEVRKAYEIGSWSSTFNEETGKTEFSALITFKKDANYTFSFDDYTNNAMNTLDKADENTYKVTGNTPASFTVDTKGPTGSVKVNEDVWNKLLKVLTFGIYNKDSVFISAEYDDATCKELAKVEYYLTSNPIALTEEQLDEIYKDETADAFKTYEGEFSVSDDSQFTVYFRFEDKAGNYRYISSDGAIIDNVFSDITITPEAPLFEDEKKVGHYASDVKVDIRVVETEKEDASYAGIQSVKYWVEKDSIKTQEAVLYDFDYDRETKEGNLNVNGGSLTIYDSADGTTFITDGDVPTQAMLRKEWSGSIVVDSALNNSCNVVVFVKTVDNSGNEKVESMPLDIDVTAPAIDITYDNNKDNGGNGYFAADRTATVTITERTSHFDAAKATAGIVIKAVNAKGEAIKDSYTISEWVTTEGATPDEAKHTAKIHFAKDANYTFEISYTDESENKNSEVNTHESVSPYKFTVDTVSPFGTVSATSKEGRTTEWNKLIYDLTFGFWSREEISITGTSDDETSPVAAVKYYIAEAKEEKDAAEAITAKDLDEVKEWKAFDKLTISDNKRFTVYIKITDNAGNYTYISTDGLIVDEEAPIEEVIAPEVTVMPEQPINGFYNGDVKVAIKVVDPLVKGSYSGLKSVSYKVYDKAVSETEPTQSGTLYTFKTENPKQEQLLKEWTGQITVESAKNNSNDIVIEVFAEDNSLNTSRDDVSVMIDTTAPAINVTYDNNKVDSSRFFKADRTATIVITERNFKPEDVVVNITNTDGKSPSITKWVKTNGTSANLDDTKWTTTVTYAKDGDYTFDIDYTDLAGNKCTAPDYAKSKAPKKFTIDKTLPVVSVSYDNNSAQNGKYFDAGRTATIVINEHNFDINRVDFIRSSVLDGRNIAEPGVQWKHEGDVHTATISYTTDGDYTFDVTVDDKAGNINKSANYGSSVAGEDFTIDLIINKPTITGVENGVAYKGEVKPTISFNDVNYASYEARLLRTRMGEKNVDVSSKFLRAVPVDAKGGSATFNTFEEIAENDGIYTLSVKIVDKAGREENESVTFTVNRFGSVYEYGDYLIDRIEKRYITSIDEDLIITEYNADRLVGGSLNIEITCDGKPLDNVKYDLSPVMNSTVAVGSSGWFQYEYTISKDNFASDGIYKIYISSEDETGNKPENTNYEDKAITFTVDSTPPEITSITGLEKDVIDAVEREVKFTVFDTVGLKSVEVYVDGELVDEPVTNFGADLNNYSGTFVLREKKTAQSVQIIVKDLADNVTDTESETFASEYVFNSKVTVSTNFFVRWYANKGLFWGSIAGFLAFVAAIIFIVVKRRKKDEE